MKKILLILAFVIGGLSMARPAKAQEQEIQQLILNLQKLNQLRAILDQLYKGYQILNKGYNTIKDLSEGNFNLHKVFLDKLLEVSPVVKKYSRVVDIIRCQQTLVKEYKTALGQFREVDVFNPADIKYLENVYGKLFDRSRDNLDELLMVITAGHLRMNDAERLSAIDRLHADMQDKLQFLRHFNNKTKLLAAQRKQELHDTKQLRDIYGIEK